MIIENTCKKHQERYREITSEQFDVQCPHSEHSAKANNGTLQISDLLPCYDPTCNGDKYAPFQCAEEFPSWCWCSGPDGPINSTFAEGLTPRDCGKFDIYIALGEVEVILCLAV